MTTPRGVRSWRWRQAARPSPRAVPRAAQQPGAKGPLVWLDMDQQALDDAYDQVVYAPNREQVAKRRIANSDKARAVIGAPERVAYGPSEIEKLDIYRTKQANAPVNIFIHGGAWRANRAADYACLAEPFVKAGAHYVILDFTNVDDAGGSLFPMVEQVRRAVGWVYKNASQLRRRSEPALSELAFLRLPSRRLRGDPRLAQGQPAGRHSQGRDAQQRHVRSQAGAALEAFEIRQVHRRDGGGAERAAAPRPAQPAAHPGLRHLRDAGIPASDPRFLRRR